MKTFTTWTEVLRYVEQSYSNPKALNRQDESGWHPISSREFMQSVKDLAVGLQTIGLKKGDRVGILAHPSPAWTIADMAIIAAGGIVVPLFANISEENFLYEVSQTDLKIIFVDGEEPWKVFQKHEHLFDSAIAMDTLRHPRSFSWQEILEKGAELNQRQPFRYAELLNAAQPEDLAAIIYTSGSTGVPKGVELTHHNLACVINFPAFHWDHLKDRYLSLLPLAHVFGHCINLWMVAWGVSIYYFNDYKKLGAIAQEVQPTAMVVVPRLLEKVYAKMVEKTHSTDGIKRWIGDLAFSMAKKSSPSILMRLLHPLLDKLVYVKLRQALGGHLRVVISGGAPLNPHLQTFFQTIGVPIYEGWGLTEACPVCVNYPGKNKIGTVGPALPGQQLRITAEGEILVKGTLVMRGYYRNPEVTAQTIDADKWLHTGDRGEIDSDGHLKIKGRMKELYKTSTGEYVAPVPIEQALGRYPFIEMAMVVAEGRKFVSCLLFPNLDILTHMKIHENVQQMKDEDFLKTPYMRKQIDDVLEQVNKHLNHWEQIHDYRFILQPLTIEGGDLTPSMKIRREVVAKKYGRLIDTMYREEIE